MALTKSGFFGRVLFEFLLMQLCCVLVGAPGAANARETVKIGILAYRSKPYTLAQWQPLVGVLKQAVPDREFAIEAFDFDELALSVASRQVDFVLTNPGHYIQLSKRNGLSAPLATLALNDRNPEQAITAFGGVIFSRADNTDIETLQDIKGKTVAVVSTEALGGYQLQAYEFQKLNGSLAQQAKLLPTGLPQDKVVQAVVNGQAAVGFVRTGVLEQMEREGKLDMLRIKLINRQNLPGYPLLLSTRLYPEWPFAAMPQIDENLARHVAAALFMLEENKPVTQAIGIHGFGVPADYTVISDLLRDMRMPPYDVVPSFTVRDIWLRYQWPLLAALLVSASFLLLTLKLLIVKRKLVVQQNMLLKQQQQLLESETFLRTLIHTLPDLIWLKNADGVYLACNPRFERFFGAEEHVIVGKTDYDFVDSELADAFREQDLLTMQTDAPSLTEKWVTFLDDGHRELLETRKIPMRDAAGEFVGVLGIGHDITEHKQAEEKLLLAASVFTHAREGILITDVDGRIIDINDTFTAITGYSREDVLHRNPRILKSDRQSKGFYAQMWAHLKENGEWSGELWNRRKNGQLYAEILTISAVCDAQGNTLHYVALFSDITPFKEYEQQLQRIAHYDALTSLPNRILLADRLRLAMTQAQRRGLQVAVVFLDLDGFKKVNDSYGHDMGDELLMTLSSRMKQALRESDTLARLGGDEFVAVLVDLPDTDACLPLLSRLLNAASQPVTYGALTMRVSASLGVSFYPQAEDIEADQLLRQADQAMYQAKMKGKNQYHLFDAE
ncbi:MAG: diguanylate cyclase [Methylomonas sp.]|jgi:diguanylate cyclase (GGDEF)-like protein/PAS domain S-box-containing protein|uniref:diguanylate cyclase domain-containing protein n=1 Tax=Methylomonas sp. TaxID=418 RepID=UPI0025F32CDF|nr:diguanylate cyclase [Methylomonas sp.]MCK9606312.1 diguanylate cyclase [Methylomonas sp.]